MFSNFFSLLSPIFWVIAYVWLLLFAYDRLSGVRRIELSGVEWESSSSTLQASSHFDHTSLLPSFYCIRSILKQLHGEDLINMWVLGSRWGSTYYLFYYQTLGSYFYVFLLCHAMLVDVDWVSEFSMTDVRLLINGLFKAATLIHIWVDWGTWFPGLACFSSDRHPGSKGS